MRLKPVLLTLATALLLIAATAMGTFVWFRHAPRRTPPGQPALSNLATATFPAFRDAFNAAVDETRVIVLLSPT